MRMLDSFHHRGLLGCSQQADLYVRDAADDFGVDQYLGPIFWNSPDVWVRNADDGGSTHQDQHSVRTIGFMHELAIVVPITLEHL